MLLNSHVFRRNRNHITPNCAVTAICFYGLPNCPPMNTIRLQNPNNPPHLKAPLGVPASSPWMSRWFRLTKVFSLAGVIANISLRLEGEPALPLVEAEWPPEKAGASREKRPPPAPPRALGKLVALLLPPSISTIAERGQDHASGSREGEQTLTEKEQGERKEKKRVCSFVWSRAG